ncbi:hypothetical protein Tco_1558837 [Tanacetum coccineum]
MDSTNPSHPLLISHEVTGLHKKALNIPEDDTSLILGEDEDDTKDTNSPIYDALNDIEVYTASNPSSPQPSSPKTQQIKELNNQVLLLTSQKTLVEEK